jgi:hypothetical protein
MNGAEFNLNGWNATLELSPRTCSGAQLPFSTAQKKSWVPDKPGMTREECYAGIQLP